MRYKTKDKRQKTKRCEIEDKGEDLLGTRWLRSTIALEANIGGW